MPHRGLRSTKKYPYHFISNILLQIFSAILCPPHNMVLMFIDGVLQASNSHELAIAEPFWLCYGKSEPFIPALQRLRVFSLPCLSVGRLRAGFPGIQKGAGKPRP